DVSGIDDIERNDLRNELIKDIDVVGFAFCNADKRGNAAVQVEQGMHLDCGFGTAEPCPGKQRQTEIDGGGIQGIQIFTQLHSRSEEHTSELQSPDQLVCRLL